MQYIIDNEGFENEINQRELLWKKVLDGKRLTEEEKIWLDTHKKFSKLLGVPYLQRDFIQLEKDTTYDFCISFISAKHPRFIAPCFKAPRLIGNIMTDGELYTFTGKMDKKKAVKMLVPLIHQDNKSSSFFYQSALKGICVSFEGEYEDKKQGMIMRRFSSDFEGLYMLREDIGENKILYKCKVENAPEFDSLVFLVEWKEVT